MEQKLNKLLTRQIERHFGSADNMPEDLKSFLMDINDTYNDFDKDTRLIQNSIELSSQELRDSYKEHNIDVDNQRKTIDKIKEALVALGFTNQNFNAEPKTDKSYSNELFDTLIRLIEEHKQAEAKLNESEEKYRLIFEFSPLGILSFDEKGIITACNDNFVKIIGSSREKLVGLNMLNLPDENIVSLVQNALKGRPGVYEGVYSSITAKKTTPISCFFGPMAVGGGNVLGGVGIIEDITIRRQTEDELKKSEENFRTLFSSIADLLFVLDGKGNIIDVNETVIRRLEYSREELIGQSVLKVHPKSRQKEVANIVAEMLAGTKNYCPVPVLSKNGVEIHVETRVYPGFWNGEPALFGVTKDITQIKQSEEKFSKAFQEGSNLMAISTISTGRYIDVNDSFLKVLGYERDEVIGKTSQELNLFDDYQLRESVKLIVDKGRNIKDAEIKIRTKTGEILIGLFSVSTIHIGDEPCWLTTMTDITELKQKDNLINRLSQAVEQSPVSIVITNLDGNIEYANPKACETTGYSIDELFGKNPKVLRSGETRVEEYTELWKTITSGKIWHGTFHNKRKNGELYWESATITPVLDENGIVVNYLAIKEDISQLKIDEQQIRDLNQNLEKKILERTSELATTNSKLIREVEERKKSEQKFATAFHSSSAMMAISDFDNGVYIDVNAAFLEVTGYTREEIIGMTNKKMGIFVDPNLRIELQKNLNDKIPVRDIEVLKKIKDGSIKTVLLSADVIYVSDCKCLLTLAIDITDRKHAEEAIQIAQKEAEKANIAKSEFLSRMSHELRTPMNSVLGFAQLLAMGELNTAQRNGVNHILQSGKHLLDLINEVLDISRIEAGRITIKIEPVHLNDVFRAMIDIMNPMAQSRQIKFNLINSPVNNLSVDADSQSFKQIMLNLLSNAVKYNKAGGTVKIKTEKKSAKSNDLSTIRISITDNGIGIKQQDLHKLFMPFERIGSEMSEIEGTGLGLAVVKKLTEAMGGTCGVESVFGKGSTFWIELPQAEQINKAENAKVLNELNQELPEKPGTVLYIEDNLSNIELVEQIITTQRPLIRLKTYMHGKQTVKRAIEHKPDLILLDLNLPDIDGSEVLRQLLENQQTKDIPVVIISADGMQHRIKELMNSGANKYLTKPLDVVELLSTIDEYIGLQ